MERIENSTFAKTTRKFQMNMTISELSAKYKDELSYSIGDQELRYNLLSPLFQNLYENKVVYHSRFTCIIQLSDIVISPERFRAKAQRLSLINSGPYGYNPILESWFFGAAWEYLRLSNERLSVYSSWVMWTDPIFVEKVEKLVQENKYKEANNILWGTH